MNIDSFKEKIEKANLWDTFAGDIENYNKHLKGYAFDSLVYRYKYALELGTNERADHMYCMSDNSKTKQECLLAARKQNERDVIKFCEILSEAIGEHD